jgi:hypothetical protein
MCFQSEINHPLKKLKRRKQAARNRKRREHPSPLQALPRAIYTDFNPHPKQSAGHGSYWYIQSDSTLLYPHDNILNINKITAHQ